MAIFAVHFPLRDGGDPAGAMERVRAVKTGFAAWALIFGPLWLIAKGLWLEFAVWLIGAILLDFAIERHVLAPGAGFPLLLLAALFLGFEGRTLQSAALTRGGRPLADIVIAPDAEDAERAFLARYAGAGGPPPAPRSGSPVSRGDSQVLGLFPEAGR